MYTGGKICNKYFFIIMMVPFPLQKKSEGSLLDMDYMLKNIETG